MDLPVLARYKKYKNTAALMNGNEKFKKTYRILSDQDANSMLLSFKKIRTTFR